MSYVKNMIASLVERDMAQEVIGQSGHAMVARCLKCGIPDSECTRDKIHANYVYGGKCGDVYIVCII